eukprot:169318-Chlamydomonas_euryale.AAC.5
MASTSMRRMHTLSLRTCAVGNQFGQSLSRTPETNGTADCARGAALATALSFPAPFRLALTPSHQHAHGCMRTPGPACIQARWRAAVAGVKRDPRLHPIVHKRRRHNVCHWAQLRTRSACVLAPGVSGYLVLSRLSPSLPFPVDARELSLLLSQTHIVSLSLRQPLGARGGGVERVSPPCLFHSLSSPSRPCARAPVMCRLVRRGCRLADRYCRQLYDGEVDDVVDCPLIVFVNSRSGGRAGADLTLAFQRHLGRLQVWRGQHRGRRGFPWEDTLRGIPEEAHRGGGCKCRALAGANTLGTPRLYPAGTGGKRWGGRAQLMFWGRSGCSGEGVNVLGRELLLWRWPEGKAAWRQVPRTSGHGRSAPGDEHGLGGLRCDLEACGVTLGLEEKSLWGRGSLWEVEASG